MTQVAIDPVMQHSGPAEFADAVWIGTVELALLTELTELTPGRLALAGAEGYTRARLLVRDGRAMAGFAEVPVADGGVDPADVLAALTAPEPGADDAGSADLLDRPPFSVVLCTRDRPDDLRAALTTLTRLDYPDFEIVVVDNASRTTATADVVTEIADPRVRYVLEPRPGLARARNTGVRAARHELIAFTDDDVAIDAHWLTGLATGFARAQDVGCVTGIVTTGELRSRSQLYFEKRVWWSHALTPRQYSLAEPPAGEVLFPFRVGLYGTGANFAARRDVLYALGGFDERLGAGAPTGSGEDIDLFVRVIVAGHVLAYEPGALIWHRHRAEPEALLSQIRNYGLGLGAWLTCVTLDPAVRGQAWRRAAAAARHILATSKVDTGPAVDATDVSLGKVRSAELRAMAAGPYALWRAGRAGASSRPLAGSTPAVTAAAKDDRLAPSRGAR